MSINKCKQCRSTKRGADQPHEEFLILHGQILRKDLSQGEQASREGKSQTLSVFESNRANPGIFPCSGCSSVPSVQGVTESVTGICLYSSQLPCCAAAIFIFVLSVIEVSAAQNRTDTNCRATIFLKILSRAVLYFSSGLRWLCFLISRTWNLNTWSPQLMGQNWDLSCTLLLLYDVFNPNSLISRSINRITKIIIWGSSKDKSLLALGANGILFQWENGMDI